MDQSHQFQVKSRWGPESPNPGEAQVGTTVTRSRVVSGADKNQQSPGEVQVATTHNRSR